MENFPTPHLAMVPRIANLLTLVLLAGTTWWSSAQRPLAQDPSVLSAKPAHLQAANKQLQLPVDNSAPAARPAITPTNSNDGIIAVGFSGASIR